MILVTTYSLFISSLYSSTDIEIGFKTTIADNLHFDAITLTLYWSNISYPCTIQASDDDTYYSCNASNVSSISLCISYPSQTDFYGLQIDINHTNSIELIKYSFIIHHQPLNLIIFIYNNATNSFMNVTDNIIDNRCSYSLYQAYDIIYINSNILFQFIMTNRSHSTAYIDEHFNLQQICANNANTC